MLIESRKLRHLVCALVTIVASGNVWAAGEKEKEAPTVYHLEVVLFRHADTQAVAKERWPEIYGVDSVDRLVYVTPQPLAPVAAPTPVAAPATKPGATKPAVATAPPPAAPAAPDPSADWFHFLGQRDFKLTSTVAKISKLPGYEVLLHTAWRQPAFDFQESAAAYVFDGMLFPEHSMADLASSTVSTPVEEEPPSPEFNPPRFSGTIKLAAGRYLHVALDLLLRGVAQTPESVDAAGNLVENPHYVIQGYRLNETRRVRIGEVHYFDHPAFGALVLVAATEKKKGANVEKETVGDAPIPSGGPDD